MGTQSRLFPLSVSVSLITGFNVETVDVSGIRLDVWDVGGQDKLRSLWKHYIQNAKVIGSFKHFPNAQFSWWMWLTETV